MLLAVVFGSVLLCFGGRASGRTFSVAVTNDLDVARAAETIEVPWSEIASRLPGVLPSHLEVKDSTGQVIPDQLLDFKPEEHRDNYQSIIFQHDFAAGEHSATFTIEETPAPVPPFPTKAFARYVPDRFDDFAWENDRIAHRIYGQALATPVAGKDQMVSSGIDVWVKRVRYSILDRWYLMGHYHEDTGEGLDTYDVGLSRGCGGTGIWDGSKLYVSGNWKTWKMLANGPVRTEFELGYEPWPAGGGMMVSETKRITLDAGSNLSAVESTFDIQGAPAQVVTLGIGLGKHPKKAPNSPLTRNEQGGWLSFWENYGAHGQVATAVLLPGKITGFAEDPLSQLVLTEVKSGEPVRYYIGAGWDRSGDFPNQASWEAYLANFSTRLKSPLKISYPDSK